MGTRKNSEPSERSIRSTKRIRSHRRGQTHEEWQIENGLIPDIYNDNDEAKHFERLRAEALARGEKLACPVCRSFNIEYFDQGYYICMSQRGRARSCASRGKVTYFSASDARQAGEAWLSTLRSSPQ